MPNGYNASAFPTSFKDPAYDQADQSAATAVGIPAQWLTNIRTKGEKSNADQISGANAATPYQIIPATRDAIIKQTGVDPYLSPQTAAYGAAYLLKQSLDRNGGNPILATAEYHGGPNRDAWGPKTMAYAKRVTGASPNNADAATSWGDSSSGGSGAYRLQSAPTVTAAPGSGESGPSPLTQLFNAYQNGKMSPDDAHSFEQDVRSGRIVLPAGMNVSSSQGTPTQQQQPQAQVAPQKLVDAFNSGAMTADDAKQFQSDVSSGTLKLPAGANLSTPNPDASHTAGVAGRGYLQGVANAVGTFADKGKELLDMPVNAVKAIGQGGGALNAVDQIFGTHLAPEVPGQNPLAGLPNMAAALPANVGETANFVMNRAGFPNAQTPGERVVQQAAEGAGAMSVPLPGVALKAIPGMIAAGATGGAVGEAVHQATGSPMLGMAANLLTTVLSPAAASRVMKAIAHEAPDVAAIAGRTEPTLQAPATTQAPEGTAAAAPVVKAAEAAPTAPTPTQVVQQQAEAGAAVPSVASLAAPTASPAAPTPTPAAQARTASVSASGAVNPAASPLSSAAQQFLSSEELAAQARKAVGAEGKPFGLDKQTARQVLATQGAPDAETLASAKRLGIEDNLQADHLTTNQAYRELAQAIKSTPGSLARADEMQGLQAIGDRAMKIIGDAGGTRDLSQLSSQIKGDLSATQQQLDQKADSLYKAVSQDVPPQTAAPAQNLLAFVQQRSEDLGGAKNLSSIEKMIQAKLAPKEMPVTINGQPVRAADVGMPTQYQQPTYALLDDVRRDIGAGLRNQGPFKDADSGLLKALYKNASEDQRATLSSIPGALEKYDAARAAVQMRKSVEDDLTSLFGKQLGDSVVGKLGTAMSALPKGDETKLIELLKSVPAGMRQQVTASGLAYAFGNATKNGELNFKAFADWMDGLKKNSAAFNAVMGNLPAETRTQLLDLAKVSRGISNATRESITTGRIMAAREELNAHADSLIGQVMSTAREAAVGHVGTAISAGAAHVAGPVGAGLSHAVISALSRGKPDVMKAADELIASPEFQQLAKEGAAPAAQTVKAAANSSALRRFYDSARHTTAANDPASRERWLVGLINAARPAANANSDR